MTVWPIHHRPRRSVQPRHLWLGTALALCGISLVHASSALAQLDTGFYRTLATVPGSPALFGLVMAAGAALAGVTLGPAFAADYHGARHGMATLATVYIWWALTALQQHPDGSALAVVAHAAAAVAIAVYTPPDGRVSP